MSGYQSLHRYKGSLYANDNTYNGIEYDFEVPDSISVSSPGGVSATHHHYTKSMYSDASSSWDLYSGEQKLYPYAEHGSLYQTGQSAASSQGEYSQKIIDPNYITPQSSHHIENYTPIQSTSKTSETPIEFINAPDSTAAQPVTNVLPANFTKSLKLVLPSPVIMFIILVIISLAIGLWVQSGQSLLLERFHGGKLPNWKWLALYAFIATCLAFLVSIELDVPLLKLEAIE